MPCVTDIIQASVPGPCYMYIPNFARGSPLGNHCDKADHVPYCVQTRVYTLGRVTSYHNLYQSPRVVCSGGNNTAGVLHTHT